MRPSPTYILIGILVLVVLFIVFRTSRSSVDESDDAESCCSDESRRSARQDPGEFDLHREVEIFMEQQQQYLASQN